MNCRFKNIEQKSQYEEIKIGDRMLRLNHNYPDEPVKWIEFIVNDTYLELMEQFPDHFRTLSGDNILFV